MSDYLKRDAKEVNEALAALAEHDRKVGRMLAEPPRTYTRGQWEALTVERRALSGTLEERAARLAAEALR